MGLFGGKQIETNKRNLVRNVIAWIVSSGDSKVLTELQIAIRLRLLFQTTKSQEN